MSHREDSTIEGHLQFHTPELNSESEEWEWPFWKFGYTNPNVLFKDLHAEYNSIRFAIQDPYGWHSDVCETAHLADTKEQFLALLRKRQDERFQELKKAWDKISILLIAESDRWEIPRTRSDLWLRFIRITRHFSYDALVGYFGAYLKEPTEPRTPKTPIALESEEHTNINETRPKQYHPIPNMVDRATQTSTATAASKKTPSPAGASPSKIVKRQTRRSKPTRNNPEGLRRSARLQQRAGRGS
ncbi:hypothetical protein F5Y12DRAFT_785229 [Xylaria sp. FL1777]|nr:hypothetical protein F5Y12DRAFT_785229 [Xylaria sp. FL1777]